MTGVELIAAERKRQIEEEGWTAEHDDQTHGIGDLAIAGACYVTPGVYGIGDPPAGWPWHPKWWKPSPNRLRNLAKAGARRKTLSTSQRRSA